MKFSYWNTPLRGIFESRMVNLGHGWSARGRGRKKRGAIFQKRWKVFAEKEDPRGSAFPLFWSSKKWKICAEIFSLLKFHEKVEDLRGYFSWNL